MLLPLTVQALFLTVSVAFGGNFNHGLKGIENTRPVVIAHRGASGVYPENTVEAFQEAIDQGSDLIECDVVVTKDLQLVCLHDNWLGEVTNVQELFPECEETLYVPDKDLTVTDCFVHRFTLAEVKTLGVRQKYSTRDQQYNYLLKVATLDEFLQVAQNSSSPVGVYPELKNPEFVNALDIWGDETNSRRYEDLYLAAVHGAGYTDSDDPCLVQCFSLPSLTYMRARTLLPCIMLRTGILPITDVDLDVYQERGFQGIGPNKGLLQGANGEMNDLVQRVHDRGLVIHPWTYRNDDLDIKYQLDIYNEFAQYAQAGIDGAFVDFPATYRRALELLYPLSDNKEN